MKKTYSVRLEKDISNILNQLKEAKIFNMSEIIRDCLTTEKTLEDFIKLIPPDRYIRKKIREK